MVRQNDKKIKEKSAGENTSLGLDAKSILISRLIAQVCIAITFVISGVAILGWILGLLIIASVNPDYIPMAPSTALSFIILSAALFIYIRQPVYPIARMFARVGVTLVLLISLLILSGFFRGIEFEIEHLLFRHSKTLGNISVGHMSPLTAVNFLLAGAAILILLTSKENKQTSRTTATFPATIVFSIGFVIVLGYIYGTPLLYGGTVIPVALTTGAAFVLLGVGIITSAGLYNWPIRLFMGSSVYARLVRAFFPFTIALVLIHGWFDVNIYPFISNPVLISSWILILSMVIVSIIVAKIAKIIGEDIDKVNLELKQAEESLRNEEEKYRSLFENANDAIYLIDPQSAKIIECNKKATEMDGYSIDELKLMTVMDLHPSDERDALLDKFKDILIKGSLSVVTGLNHMRKDGGLVPIEVNATMIEIGGKNLNLSVVRDVTERKKAEEEIKQRVKELEEFYEMAVGRELRMKELKKKIKELEEELRKYRGNEV